MHETTRSQRRDPWSLRGLVIGAWRSIIMLLVGGSTLDRRELEKLDSRWESEDAANKAKAAGARADG